MGRIKGCSSFKDAEHKLRCFNRSREELVEEESFSTYFVYICACADYPAHVVSELGYFPLREARLRFAQWLETVADFNKYELRNARSVVVSTGVAKRGTQLLNKNDQGDTL